MDEAPAESCERSGSESDANVVHRNAEQRGGLEVVSVSFGRKAQKRLRRHAKAAAFRLLPDALPVDDGICVDLDDDGGAEQARGSASDANTRRVQMDVSSGSEAELPVESPVNANLLQTPISWRRRAAVRTQARRSSPRTPWIAPRSTARLPATFELPLPADEHLDVDNLCGDTPRGRGEAPGAGSGNANGNDAGEIRIPCSSSSRIVLPSRPSPRPRSFPQPVSLSAGSSSSSSSGSISASSNRPAWRIPDPREDRDQRLQRPAVSVAASLSASSASSVLPDEGIGSSVEPSGQVAVRESEQAFASVATAVPTVMSPLSVSPPPPPPNISSFYVERMRSGMEPQVCCHCQQSFDLGELRLGFAGRAYAGSSPPRWVHALRCTARLDVWVRPGVDRVAFSHGVTLAERDSVLRVLSALSQRAVRAHQRGFPNPRPFPQRLAREQLQPWDYGPARFQLWATVQIPDESPPQVPPPPPPPVFPDNQSQSATTLGLRIPNSPFDPHSFSQLHAGYTQLQRMLEQVLAGAAAAAAPGAPNGNQSRAESSGSTLATQSALNMAPVQTLSVRASEDCVVCREPMLVGEACRRLPCLHLFHKDCIDRWFQVKTTCPLDNLRLEDMLSWERSLLGDAEAVQPRASGRSRSQGTRVHSRIQGGGQRHRTSSRRSRTYSRSPSRRSRAHSRSRSRRRRLRGPRLFTRPHSQQVLASIPQPRLPPPVPVAGMLRMAGLGETLPGQSPATSSLSGAEVSYPLFLSSASWQPPPPPDGTASQFL